MSPRRDIIRSARNLLRTPFHHQGRVPGHGIDCAGVLVEIARDLGMPFVDCPSYSRFPRHGTMSDYLRKSGCQEIPVSRAIAGDILTFWYQKRDRENHGAVLSERNGTQTIIHAYADIGMVLEQDFDEFWRERVMTAWMFPGVNDREAF